MEKSETIMKVGFIAPLSIAAVNGGVRTQAFQTAEALKNNGIEVEFISPWQKSIDVDLVHVFAAGIETLGIISRCKELGIKVVLSPVLFSNRTARVIANVLRIEKLMGKIGSGVRSEFGIKAEACKLVDRILPNTSDEASLIQKGFGIPDSKIQLVPNGVETRFLDAKPTLFWSQYEELKDFILFAGQAGAERKNVIKLLEAAPSIERSIVIIGSFYENEYGHKCKKLANQTSNVTLIDPLPHNSEILASAYAACHTFVLPSYFETPGIAALEAALAGANIVISERGVTKDYFSGFARFVN
ncbi:MAG: glycosyltransferase, partial [Balneolales bacterium]|nr:glycosyltransferase [Balneolales bacterium]